MTLRPLFCRSLITLLALLLVVFSAPRAGAEALPRAVLIVDGSGSMWGRIGDREKIVIARETLAEKIGVLKGVVDLGVMSYGHQRRRDCRDVQTLVPVSPIDEDLQGKAIRRLLPRGKTPTATALQQAVVTLGPAIAGQKSHIILVADGGENCRMDPCATAEQITAIRPDVIFDVIAFAVSDEEQPGLACISQSTNGLFLKAEDGATLAAAVDQVFDSLKKGAVTATATQKPTIPPGLYLSASLSEEGKPLGSDLTWRVYKKGESSKQGATPVKRDSSAHPVLHLPDGDYRVEVRYGPLSTEQDVQIEANGAQKLRLNFNVGIVTGQAELGENMPASGDVILSLYDAATGPPGPRNILSHKPEKEAVFYLAPGKYGLKAKAGEAEAWRQFELKAGERLNVLISLDAGQVALSTRLAAGGPNVERIQYALYRKAKGDDVHYSEFLRTLDPEPKLILPAGDYLVHAQKDAANVVQSFTLAPGESKSLSLTLNAGTLQLSSALKDGDVALEYTLEPVTPLSSRSIELADNRRQRLDRPLPSHSTRESFVLPAGTYVVKATYGNSNVRAETRISIAAGEEKQQKIEMPAGHIEFSLSLAANDPALPGVFWSVFDSKGTQIASASRARPRLTLQAGKYKVVADYLGNSYRRDFDVRVGDNQKLSLTIKE